MILDRQISIEL